jgi:beta-lactam-binding protein with PASTA domain
VVGKGFVTAAKRIARAHCKTGTVTKAYSKKVRTGYVIAETPKAGTHLKSGGTVRLVVSRGRRAKR